MGFVVDLNISRVLNTCLDYNVYKKDLNVEQKFTYLVENNLINIDNDLFKGKENKTKLVEKLLHIWKADPIHNLKILLKKIEDNIIDLDTKDQKSLNQYFTSSVGDEKVNVKVKFDDESEDSLPKGKTPKKQDNDDNGDNDENDENDKSEEEEPKTTNISLTKDVLPFIVPLICILTIDTEQKDILEMLNMIKTSPSLLNVFEDQSFIWWNKPDIIKLIEAIVKKYIKKNSGIYNIAIQFKMSLQCLIDKPKELLELIDSCLKPKQKEKQENGEVFTPMSLVFEMLDNLDKHYSKEKGRSIFTEKDFKWFDPASGMGNFPVAVYLRLIEGLKHSIPNDEERKKHIIENMLYMSELNKKNVFINHQIFNMNNQYKLNLYEGDTLELDIMKVWGLQLNSFDVILGNPPYNKGGIWSHTKKTDSEKREVLWMIFIKQSFKWLKADGLLTFITPLYWLKINIEVHNLMLEKHIVWLKLWDDSQSKRTINADIPISLYVLQNTLNTQNKKTEIISEIKRKKLTTISFEYLNPNYSIPLAFHSIFDKLMQFIEKQNCRLEYKTKTIKSSGTKSKAPSEYVLEDNWAIDTYTLSEGILVKKAIEQHPDAKKRKLIIANKRGFKGAFIDEGKLSLTGTNKYYILGDNLEIIKKILGFNINVVISDFLKYSQSFLDKEAFKYIPDIRKLGITDITEDEFYKLLGLTLDEINQIKNPLTKKETEKNYEDNEDNEDNEEVEKEDNNKTEEVEKEDNEEDEKENNNEAEEEDEKENNNEAEEEAEEDNNEENINNLIFNNNENSTNLSKFLSAEKDVIIQEDIAIGNESLIYTNDNVYLQELENQLLSEYPVTQQDKIFLQRKVEEEAKRLIEVKNIGVKMNKMYENNIEYSLINDIINDNFNSNLIIPVILDKHKIYIKLKEENIDSTENKEEDYENVYFSESHENPDGVFEANQKQEMASLKQLLHEYKLSKLSLKSYLNKFNEYTNPYLIKNNDSNGGFIRKPINQCLALRYNEIDSLYWNTRITNNNLSYSKDLVDENGKIKGLQDYVLVKGEEINIVGFMILPNNTSENSLEKSFKLIGNISRIYKYNEFIGVEIKNHNLNNESIICIEESNSIPKINHIYSHSIKIIDKDNILLETKKKILKEGTSGILYSLQKLDYDLYKITKPDDKINIELKGTTYKNRKALVDINKLYLFDKLKINKKSDYDEIIKTIAPSRNDIINDNILKLKNIYTFDDFNNILKNYRLTINDFQINEILRIKDILKDNLEKLINKKPIIDTNPIFRVSKNNGYFQNNDYFLSNYFINNPEIIEKYGSYFHFNKKEDNLFLRLKWINERDDFSEMYHIYLLQTTYNEVKKNYQIKYIQNKIKQLKDILGDLEKVYKKSDKKSCTLYKFQPYIITNSDIKDGFDNMKKTQVVKNGDAVFYQNNILQWKDGKMIPFTNLEEHTLALVDGFIWSWQKGIWGKSDNSVNYEKIRYLCNFGNIDLTNINLDKLDCIYRSDTGCSSKIESRLEDNIKMVSESLEKFKQLEQYLKNNELLIQLDDRYNKIKDKILIKRDQDGAVDNKNSGYTKDSDITESNLSEGEVEEREETESEINYNSPINKLIKYILKLKNNDNRLQFIYDIIDKDTIVIDNKLYSKKYKTHITLCPHYISLKKIDYAVDISAKTALYNEMIQLYSDGGDSEKNLHICKLCGSYLSLNDYDDTEGFSDSGMIKRSRETWDSSVFKEETKDLLNYLSDSISLDCDSKDFKSMLLKYGLSIDDVDKSIEICNFITKNLYPKSGVYLPNNQLIFIIIDSVQKIKNIIPFNRFRLKEIKKLQDKGIGKETIQKIEERRTLIDAYEKYIKIKEKSIISARFLISVQTIIPGVTRQSKSSICVFYSFDGNNGINYISCLLEEMKIVIQDLDTIKARVLESYNDFIQLQHIKKLFRSKREYEDKLLNKTNLYQFNNEAIDGTVQELLEYKDNKAINYLFQNIDKVKNSENVHKLYTVLTSRLKYLSKKIKAIVYKYISSNPLSDTYSGLLESSCCAEEADIYNDYYYSIKLESEEALSNIIEESNTIYGYLKYFISGGSTHKFEMYDKNRFDGTTNVIIVDDEINTSQKLIKLVFENYVDTGFYVGTLRQYSGYGNNIIDIKTGMTKTEILSKEYTIEEYQKLLENISKHHIKYYNEPNKVSLDDYLLGELKNKSYNIIDKEINKLLTAVSNTLNKKKDFIDTYKDFFKSVLTVDIPTNNQLNKKELIGIRDSEYKKKLNYFKSFYINKLKKYLSLIKNNRNKIDDNIKLNFINSDAISLEIQSDIFNDNQKLNKFLTDEIRSYFMDLNVDFTNDEINSIYGIDNIYKSNYENIKKFSDFNFTDAFYVILYILISQMNKFIYFYECSKSVKKDDNLYKENFKKEIYDNGLKTTKCQYICELINILLEEMLEYNDLFVKCKEGAEGIKNSLRHDFIMKKASLIKKEEDDYLTGMMQRKFDEMAGESVENELEIEQEEIDKDMKLHELDDYILGEGYKKLVDKLGHEPNNDELESYRNELMMISDENKDYDVETFSGFLEVQMDKDFSEKMDAGADYGGLQSYDFEDGDGFDYS
jgi:hypothetical protein